MSTVLHACFVLVTLAWLATIAHAAEQVATIDDNDVVGIVPEFKKLPAPDWVKPGVQIANAFYSAMSRPGGGYDLADNGDFVDQYGNHYNEAKSFGSAGQGFTITSIVGVDEHTVAMHTNLDLASVTGPLAPSMVLAGVTYAGANNVWIHPAGLKALLAGAGPGRKISRTPFAIGNQKFNAVILMFHPSPGSNHYWVWDEDTGLLLKSSSVEVVDASPGVDTAKSTRLMRTTFAGMRTLKLPWNNARPPAWTGEFHALDYQGTTAMNIVGANTPPSPLQMSLTAGRRGPGWVETSLHVAAGAGKPPAAVVRTLNSIYSLMGCYVPPEGLSQLRTGQVLDEDPITRFTYTVTGTTQLADGTKVVVIREAGKVHAVDCGYDLNTGTLVLYRKSEQLGSATTTTTQAQLVRRR
ncbi:MAG: hypothetical protein ABSH20_10440 [Tepidisphaeraceae bacterium]|jgi:hypothetical protein